MITLQINQSIAGEPAGDFNVYLLENSSIAVEGFPSLHGWYSFQNETLVITISNPTDSSPPNPFSATIYYGKPGPVPIEPPIYAGKAYGTSTQGDGFVELEWRGTFLPFEAKS